MSPDISQNLETAARDIPEEVTSWLGRLVLLYGVPFNYLIPADEMLPKESIRFFFVDPIWIQNMVQGACSVGNADAGDTIIDAAMNTLVRPKPAKDQDPGPANKAAAGVRDRLRSQMEGVEAPDTGEDLAWPLTGFLLRSTVVDGWRGLEFMAYKKISEDEKKNWDKIPLNEEQQEKLKKNMAPLKPLRIEQLSQDVMLGIFNGLIGQLVIRQPQEGLHFGLTVEGQTYSKTVRNLKTGQIIQGQTIKLSPENLMREQKYKGVIKIAALADSIKSHKFVADQLTQGKFTSAEFGVEMIEAPGEFTFKPQN